MNLDRIWVRSDQKRIIKRRAAEEDKTIPDVLDDLIGTSGLTDYNREIKNAFKKIL